MSWPAKLRRWLLRIGLVLILIVAAAIVLLRVMFEGERLGGSVTDLLNAKMRGHIEIASIEWPKSAIPTLATGGWVPVTMRGVKVWDAGTPAKQVLQADLITGEADIHALLFKQQFVFRHIVVEGGSVLIEQVDEPYPLHAYDNTVISLLQAFQSPHHAGFSTGVFVAGSSVFDIQDFELRHMQIDLHMGNYTSTEDPKHPVPAFTSAIGLRDTTVRGSLYMDGSDPLVPKLYFALADPSAKDPQHARPGLVAGKGSFLHIFEIGGQPVYAIPLDEVTLERVEQLPTYWPNIDVANTLDLVARIKTSKGATLAINGGLEDYFDRPYDGQWKMHITGENLGPTLNDTFTSVVGGADVRADLTLRGPYIALPKVAFAVTGLELDLPIGAKGAEPLRLALDSVEGEIDNVNDQLRIDRTVAHGAGGEVQLAGTVQLAPIRVDGNVFITKPLDLARWLPPKVHDVIGTRLSGSIHAAGDIAAQLRFDDLTNVALGNLRFDRRGAITADHYFDQIYFTKVGVSSGATAATINGQVDTVEDTFKLDVDADSKDLDVWLRRLGLPAYARSGGGTIHVRDSWAKPKISGHVYAGGVAVIDNVSADIALSGDDLAIQAMQSKGLGGSLTGSGHVALGGGMSVKDFHVTGRDLDAARIPGTGGAATGKIAKAELEVSGPVSRLLVVGGAETDHLELGGDVYDHVAMCINDDRRRAKDVCTAAQPRVPPPSDPADKAARAEVTAACDSAHERGGLCVTARADRQGGGTVDVTAVLGKSGALAGALDLVGLPLSAFLGPDGPAGGDLDTHVYFGGTTAAPTADGAIALTRGWLQGAFLGDAQLAVKTAGPGKIELTGTALQGRVVLDATLGTTPPYPATITADLRRVDVDPFVDLRPYLHVEDPVHGWASGRITVTTVLAPPGGAAPPIDATVALSELSLTVDQRDADGRPAPLVVAAASPVRLRYHDGALDLVCVDPQPGAPPHITPCPVQLATPAGTITIAGSLRPGNLGLDVTGTLDVALLRPLLADYVDESGGTADLDVHVQGSIAAPKINATLTMNDVWFRPVRQDTVIHLAEGTVGVKDNDDLGFTGMKLTVKDNYSGETSELDLSGGIKLDHWKPKHWAVTLDGDLPAKLVLALAPETFSNASGVADIEVQLQGYGAQPALDGRMTFDPQRPFTLVPRDVRRELIASDGWVNLVDEVTGSNGDACHPPKGDANAQVGNLRSYRIDLCNVGGSIDEEGHLHDIIGTLELEDWSIAGGDVTLSGDNLPFRVPHVVEATVNAEQLHLFSDQATGAWSLAGGVEIVTGSYTKTFDLLNEVIKPQASSGGGGPAFWEESPAIANASLDLTVDVRKFSVENNLATIDLSGQLAISGTPRDPRFDGTIQVGRGAFRMPGSRAKFTRSSGSVTFSRLSHFPNETPALAIESEADYRDPSGQQHLITLTLDGTLSQLNWNLFTSSGLNKAQTLTLILSGRTPEQFKRQLGNDAVGTDPTHIETSTNPNDSYADQLIKDVAADFISLLVEDSLKDVSKLDVARLEIGTGSIGFHGEKKVTDTINVLGDLEQTVRGRTVYVRGEWHAPYKFILQAGYLSKTFDDAAEDDISDLEAKLVYRFFIP